MRLIDADKIKFKWINGVICVEPKDIEKIPTVDAVPVRHGRWIEEVTDDGHGFPRTEYICPFCQYKTQADTNYCPECGAGLSEE